MYDAYVCARGERGWMGGLGGRSKGKIGNFMSRKLQEGWLKSVIIFNVKR